MSYKSKIYLPAVATSLYDLIIRYDMLSPFREKAINTGLMLVLKQEDFFNENSLENQSSNIHRLLREIKQQELSLLFMHPNMPVEGSPRLNFLNNPELSKQYIKRSIDFMEKIPDEALADSSKVLSFHLNSLISYANWNSDYGYWQKIFNQILTHLQELQIYAAKRNIELVIETSPIPEFGDRKNYHKLRNPFPLLFWRKEIQSLRNIGINLVIDICHVFIALKTLQEVQNLIDKGHDDALNYYGFFKSDLEFASSVNDFSKIIINETKKNDIWHINDAKGIYKTSKYHNTQEYFEEGIALFEGDIPKNELKKIIVEGLQKSIPIVLEINETDFKKNQNTKKSLAKVLEDI